MRSRLILASLVGAAIGWANAVLAERADRDKPTVIEADRGVANELQQTNVWTGNVVLTKGTLRITGDKLELKQSPDGFRTAVVTGPEGSLATFRQRRDATQPGVVEVVEGVADRIEWNERTDTVRFVGRALWKRLENGAPRDEVSGALITYNATTATYVVDSGEARSDRVRAVIAPRNGPGNTPKAEAPPATLKTAPQLQPRR